MWLNVLLLAVDFAHPRRHLRLFGDIRTVDIRLLPTPRDLSSDSVCPAYESTQCWKRAKRRTVGVKNDCPRSFAPFSLSLSMPCPSPSLVGEYFYFTTEKVTAVFVINAIEESTSYCLFCLHNYFGIVQLHREMGCKFND